MVFITPLLIFNCMYTQDEPTEQRKKNDNVIFDSAILRTADGHFITYDDVGIMLQLREYLRTMLYGTKDKSGILVGPYIFDDIPHCLRTLTLLEKKLDATVRDAWLTQVRDAFKERTQDTKKRAEGTKTQQYMYIKESCRLHNRPNSILLLWAQAPEGQEDDAIDIHVRNFYDMAKFVLDLKDFLEDMVSSCPKAKKQFLDRIPNKEEHQKLQQLLDHILEQQKAKINKVKSIDS